MDFNKAQSAREEAYGKIRGKRKAAWGRVEERGRVVNTAARRKVEDRFHLMESLESCEWMCHRMQRRLWSKGIEACHRTQHEGFK